MIDLLKQNIHQQKDVKYDSKKRKEKKKGKIERRKQNPNWN